MSFFDTLQQMIVILFAMVLGYTAQKKGVLTQAANGVLSKLLLNITAPALILGSAMVGEALPEFSELLSILKVAVFFYGMEFLIAFAAAPLIGGGPKQRGVWRFALSCSNMGFIGFPVVMKLFGPEKLIYAAILMLPFNVISYSFGPLMLAGAKSFSWKQFTSPSVLASFGALFISLFRIRLPALVGECVNFIGDITVPLSLVLVGSLLAAVPVGKVFTNPRLWLITASRLLIQPALIWLILRNMPGVSAVVMGVAVIEMGMPVAANGSMLSIEHGGDTETVAQITFLTTLLSIVTIPLVAAVFL